MNILDKKYSGNTIISTQIGLPSHQGTWMTRHKQHGGMLWFSSVVVHI